MRADQVIVEGPEFDAALQNGRTLDELGLRGGDVVMVAAKPAGGAFFKILGGVSAFTSLIWLGVQIF